MASFLTDGRVALLNELQDDLQIADRVNTWFEFGPGLDRRFNVEPSACPFLALSPAGGQSERTANAITDVVQRLRLEVGTSGGDIGPCEELIALILLRIQACDESCLGLAGEGLAAVTVEETRWQAVPARSGPHVVWTGHMMVALRWKRT